MKIEQLSDCDKTETKSLITKLELGQKNRDRINVFVDDKFFCSLSISQVADLGLKQGRRLGEDEKEAIKFASEFGKLYIKALAYIAIRQRSTEEMRVFLQRKTKKKLVRKKNRKTGLYEVKELPGYSLDLVDPVLNQLLQRKLLDDAAFARRWVETRRTVSGISKKKLEMELKKKGIAKDIIEEVLTMTTRNDRDEIKKIITKKSGRYGKEKLERYLLQRGFNYYDIQSELSVSESLDDSDA